MTTYCDYCNSHAEDILNKVYHDTQYGFPIQGDNLLFERLILEINQAGLSWITILKKADNFRAAYSRFDIDKIVSYDETDRARLLSDAGIIRNRLKVTVAIENARRIQALRIEYGSFKGRIHTQYPQTLENWTKLFKRNFIFTGGKNLFNCVHPCQCGYYGDPIKPCTCAPSSVTKYQKRISGPLLDRIDIHIEVPRVDYQKLSSDRLGESSETIRQRVQAARDRQRMRFANIKSSTSYSKSDVIANADMRVGEIRQFCKLDEAGESLIRAAMGQMNLSARGYHRILKLARTIADLAGSEPIQVTHLAEALQYRPKLMVG